MLVIDKPGPENLATRISRQKCQNGKINWSFVKYINDYIHGSIKDSQRDLGLVNWVNFKMFLEYRKKCYYDSMITILESNLGNLKDNNKTFLSAYIDQPCRSEFICHECD